MAAKKKAAGAATGVVAAGQAVRSNPYLQRVAEDDELRENLRLAFESSRKAYARMSNGKGPTKALLDDKKTQKELKKAAGSLSDVADSLRGAKKGRKRRRGGLLLLIIIAVGAGLALSEDLRKRVLDLLFGAEEEFEYTSTTTAPPVPPTPVPPVVGDSSTSPGSTGPSTP
ncbi:MAG: hypothetical protein H0U25_11825 [Thermoleophilaceae bacterium]|nr:hypothetical protein [Thermoleophilaceae bacterium]